MDLARLQFEIDVQSAGTPEKLFFMSVMRRTVRVA